MTDAEWIESFESKQGMGACIVEGQEIAAVVRALEAARRTVSGQEEAVKAAIPEGDYGFDWIKACTSAPERTDAEKESGK
jgi:hypothetical protein